MAKRSSTKNEHELVSKLSEWINEHIKGYKPFQ